MGDVVLAGFAALSVVGLALIGVGAARRARLPLVLGCAGARRCVGPRPGGVALGAVPLFFMKRR